MYSVSMKATVCLGPLQQPQLPTSDHQLQMPHLWCPQFCYVPFPEAEIDMRTFACFVSFLGILVHVNGSALVKSSYRGYF